MPERQTMNVSLPPAQEQLVRDLVSSGRYATASEVLREGLRLVEREEHGRLLEEHLLHGLSDEDLKRVPAERIQQFYDHLREKLEVAAEAVRRGDVRDGPAVMEDLRQRIRGGSSRRKSA